MKQNNPCYLFSMYEPDTNSVIINAINDTYTDTPIIISCEKCNSAVLLDTPDDIEYSCAMKSHFRKFGNQMSGSGNHLCNYASLLA